MWIVVLELGSAVGSGSYFGLMATLSNTFRQFSPRIASKMMELDETKTRRFAGTLPPRCISGRWLSTLHFQQWVLARGWCFLRTIVFAVFADLPEIKKAAAKHGPRDETEEESAAQFSAKLGRWRQRTVTVLQCNMFEVIRRRDWVIPALTSLPSHNSHHMITAPDLTLSTLAWLFVARVALDLLAGHHQIRDPSA